MKPEHRYPIVKNLDKYNFHNYLFFNTGPDVIDTEEDVYIENPDDIEELTTPVLDDFILGDSTTVVPDPDEMYNKVQMLSIMPAIVKFNREPSLWEEKIVDGVSYKVRNKHTFIRYRGIERHWAAALVV